MLENIDNQTEEICLNAVRENGYDLQYVKYQTMEICMAAVQQNGLVLCYVKQQTPEICIEAIRQNKKAIRYVHDDIDFSVNFNGKLILQRVKVMMYYDFINNKKSVEQYNPNISFLQFIKDVLLEIYDDNQIDELFNKKTINNVYLDKVHENEYMLYKKEMVCEIIKGVLWNSHKTEMKDVKIMEFCMIEI